MRLFEMIPNPASNPAVDPTLKLGETSTNIKIIFNIFFVAFLNDAPLMLPMTEVIRYL
jgi:hypothetical protein